MTITLADEIDIARGDMFAALRDRAAGRRSVRGSSGLDVERASCFPGRSYLMKINNSTLGATVTELKHQLDVNTLSKLAAKTLALNESASAIFRSPGRSRSILMPTIAIPAPSS